MWPKHQKGLWPGKTLLQQSNSKTLYAGKTGQFNESQDSVCLEGTDNGQIYEV